MNNISKMLATTTIAAFALSGCMQGTNTQSAPNDYQKTKQGATVGAVVGAVGGLLTSSKKDKGSSAVKGALIGSALGAAIGNQLDKQEADLRRDLGNDNVIIQNTGDRLIVTLPQDILFDVDSTYIRPDLRQDLASLANNLIQYPNTTVQIIGHTDNTGGATYNQELSVSRATVVARVLSSNGVAPGRLIPMGRGEDQPIASNLTDAGRAQNRRVEVVILPNAAG